MYKRWCHPGKHVNTSGYRNGAKTTKRQEKEAQHCFLNAETPLAGTPKGTDSGTRGPMEERLGMLGDNAALGSSSTAVTTVLLKVLFIVLNYLGRDLFAVVVLLAVALRCCSRGYKRHSSAAAVGNQIRGRRNAGYAPRATTQLLLSSVRCSSRVDFILAVSCG